MELDKNTIIAMYRTMLTIRVFDHRASKEFRGGAGGNIPGLVHSYVGQEAVATGVCAALRKEDRIVSNHRGHGHLIAKGADVRRMMAEIYGRETGYCKGKGGSMHIADFSIGILGANGIVGAGLPISTGAALAAMLEGKGRIAVVFSGDGACQEGSWAESLNLASIWKLPLIFACENNQYGVNTHYSYAIAGGDLCQRAAGFNVPVRRVDGNDVVAVHQATRETVEKVRHGAGPHFIEFVTYRWYSHFEAPTIPDLRPRDEIEDWKKKDPVAGLEKRMLAEGIMTRAEMDEINRQVMDLIEEAVRYAGASPWPAPEDALEDVYSK